ncbi:uncharacterized protein [Panulirus ornatus]
MRLAVIVCVVLGVLAASEGFLVGPGSGVPGGIISGLWWIVKVALSVALIKKGNEKKELYEYPPEYYHDPPEPTYDPPAQRYHKRSTTQETWGEEVVELEKLLVSAASRLDTDGCVLKLLCHLNNKQAHARTLEENVLLQLFSNNPDTLSFYHATFDNTAADVSKTQEQVATAACDKVFSSCTLGQEELSSLLQHTWPCPNITP